MLCLLLIFLSFYSSGYLYDFPISLPFQRYCWLGTQGIGYRLLCCLFISLTYNLILNYFQLTLQSDQPAYFELEILLYIIFLYLVVVLYLLCQNIYDIYLTCCHLGSYDLVVV